MTEQSIVVRKRRFFEKKVVWILGGAAIIVMIGLVVQLNMTWSRERLRGVSDDAQDAWHAAESGASSIVPSSNPFQPILDLFTASDASTQ